MKRAVTFVLLLLLTTSARAACANRVFMDNESTAGIIFITFDIASECGVTPAANIGDDVEITSGNQRVAARVQRVRKTSLGPSLQVTAAAAGTAAEDSATLEQFENNAAAKVVIGEQTFDATVRVGGVPPLNVARYSWSLGPATKDSQDDDDESTPTTLADEEGDDGDGPTGTFRLQYDGEYARPGFFGRGDATSRFQTAAKLKLDTTNSEDTDYIDDNELSVGVHYVNLPVAGFLSQVRAGVEGKYNKAFHHDVHDLDAVATVSAWVPGVPAVTLLGSGPKFIAPPLSVTLSYGYRSKRLEGEDYRGRAGEATANYYFYAFDRYEVGLSGTWTLNDLSNRPADVPRTARLYKISLGYLSDPAAGFKVMTSIEDGRTGPLLEKVRQYFVGLAISRFSGRGLLQ